MWKQKKSQTSLSEYPQGTFVKTEKGYYYIVSPNKRFLFLTGRVLESWSPQRIVETTEENLSKYRIGAKMKFRSGSLLWCQADAKMYLVSDNKVRHITSPDILSGLGAKHNDAVWVSQDEINLHEQGDPLG
jgi:hypothetical protein